MLSLIRYISVAMRSNASSRPGLPDEPAFGQNRQAAILYLLHEGMAFHILFDVDKIVANEMLPQNFLLRLQSLQYRKLRTTDDISSCLDGEPSRPNCRGGLYPSAIKGCREYFSPNVQAAIHVGMDDPLIAGIIPASISTPTELWLHFSRWIIGRKRITVEKTRR